MRARRGRFLGLAARTLLGLVLVLAACSRDGAPSAGVEPAVAEAPAPRAVKLLDPEADAKVVRHAMRAEPSRSVRFFSSGFEAARGELELVLSDERVAVELPVPGDWSTEVDVPAGATLVFATRIFLPELGLRHVPLRWSVTFAPSKGGQQRVLWDAGDAPRPPDGGPWMERRVDLSKLAGQRGTLTFSAAPMPGGSTAPPPEMRAILASPALATSEDRRPSVLIVTVDTLRRDMLAPYGGDPELTPAIARFARRGVIVERAWSSAPWTLPAYASLLTGQIPTLHGAGRVGEAPTGEGDLSFRGISPELPTLVRAFSRAGYATQAFHNNIFLGEGSGLQDGFDGYVRYGKTGKTAVRVFRDWLRSVGDRPYFCVVHLMDPHSPYIVPAAFDAPAGTPTPQEVPSLGVDSWALRRDGVPEADREGFRKLYEALVAYVDARFGELVDAAEQRTGRTTVIVLHADHGEELWDHGGWYHGHSYHSELVGVPLIFSAPGLLPEGVRVQGPFRDVDVLPTLLHFAGLWPVPGNAPAGVSLWPMLRGEPLAAPPALSEASLFAPEGSGALTTEGWRLLVDGRGGAQLFAIDEDPLEQHDLAADQPDRVRAMSDALQRLRTAAATARAGTTAPAMPASPELHDLGYAGGD